MDDDFIVLGASKAHDPDGAKLRGALQAHVALEHARGRRELIGRGLAVSSAPLWLLAVRPAWISSDLRALFLAAWLMLALGLVVACFSEWRWHRARAASAAGLSLPMEDEDPAIHAARSQRWQEARLAPNRAADQSDPACGGGMPRP